MSLYLIFFPKKGMEFFFLFYSKVSTLLKVELLSCSPFTKQNPFQAPL